MSTERLSRKANTIEKSGGLFRPEDQSGKWRESEGGGEGLIVARFGSGDDLAEITLVAAAVDRAVAVEEFLPNTFAGETKAVVGAEDGSEIQNNGELDGEVAVLANVGKNAAFVIAAIEPIETFVIEIGFPER